MRLKRGLDVEKQVVQVPQPQGADHAKMRTRYSDPKTAKSALGFSTREIARELAKQC
jgi:hypothetical protein